MKTTWQKTKALKLVKSQLTSDKYYIELTTQEIGSDTVITAIAHMKYTQSTWGEIVIHVGSKGGITVVSCHKGNNNYSTKKSREFEAWCVRNNEFSF